MAIDDFEQSNQAQLAALRNEILKLEKVAPVTEIEGRLHFSTCEVVLGGGMHQCVCGTNAEQHSARLLGKQLELATTEGRVNDADKLQQELEEFKKKYPVSNN